MAPALSICGLQLCCTPCERDRNLARHAALVRQNPGHHLYVFPELSTCGYDDAVFERLEEFAENVRQGPSAAFFGKLCGRTHQCHPITRTLSV
jgi:predicted amidohydrolase|eukprot:COSAG06_NODE_5308_length_3571_cov_21.023906_6_plen_93_part_00